MVITIIILIILATITINFAFGENGLITRAQWAQEQYEIEQVREKLEMAKGSAFADGKGKIDPDHYFDILEQEEIIGSKENDVKDNGDGTYDVTTNEGYIFEITLVPSAENPEDLEIEYVGKGDVTGPRITSFTSTGRTTNSISVAVEGRNLDGAEYTYSYKKSSEGEETWTEYETSENSTCTISGLETGVVYDIKVVVTTSEGTAEKELSEITGELKEGSITIGNIVWQGDGTAKVTVTTDITEPGCYIEYKIGADGDTWTRIASGDEITLQLNDEVYVRVTDGTNVLKDAYRRIEDTTNPIISKVETSNVTSDSITVTVTAEDNESGLATNGTYKYYLNNGSAITSTENSYTFEGLEAETMYTIKVEVFDKAGNKGEDSVTVTTGSETIESILKAGDYVNYIDKNGTTRKCVVLYDSSSEYGIQIITMNTVEEISMLLQFCDPSHTTIDLSQYNNIITILNTEAEKYLNPTFASMARSVGSVPDNPNYDGAGMYTISESWMAKYSGTFKDTDNNYEEDMNQMKLLQIDNIGEYYLMASRFVEYDNADNWITITLFVRNYSPSSGENWGPLILMSNENWSSPGSSTHTEGLRPVFKLKDNLKVTGGDGSEGDPYTLGV